MKEPIQTLDNLETFLREAVSKPGAQIAAADLKMIVETLLNRPLLNDQVFPGTMLLQMLISRVMGDVSSEEIKQTSEGQALMALLPYISQLTTAVIEQQSMANAQSAS